MIGLAAAKDLFAVPLEGVGERPEEVVFGADEAAAGQGGQVAGYVFAAGELGG